MGVSGVTQIAIAKESTVVREDRIQGHFDRSNRDNTKNGAWGQLGGGDEGDYVVCCCSSFVPSELLHSSLGLEVHCKVFLVLM